MSDSVAPWTAAPQAYLSITNSQNLLKLKSIESVDSMVDAIQPSHPMLTPSPPAFNLSQHQCLFQRVSSSHHFSSLISKMSGPDIKS